MEHTTRPSRPSEDLVGAVASSRLEDRTDTNAFLTEADQAATRLGADANYLWTAFAPTTSPSTG